MILYHGSNILIDKIDLNKCRPFKDFGRGFYLTEIHDQAHKMALRTSLINKGEPKVTEFEFDKEKAFNKLNVKFFDKADEEWASFIMSNRNKNNLNSPHDYDIVIGPVADDAMAVLFRNFDNGLINIEMLVKGLKYEKVSSQYFFHTKGSLKYLKRICK